MNELFGGCKQKRFQFRCCSILLGYGFVDYDNEKAAVAAVQALQSSGIQAQMAKV